MATPDQATAIRTLSVRRNFVWSFVGNAVYNLAQWLLVVALARLGNASMVGQFALMLAVAAPVYMTVGLNLRVVRATDVRRTWSPAQYHRLRLVLNALSMVLTVGIGVALGLRGDAILALVFVACGKAVETTSLMLYGFFQLRERLDLVSRSFLLRAGLGVLGFVTGLLVTGDLAPACAGLVTGWLVTWLVHDRPLERRLLRDDDMARVRDGFLEPAPPSSVRSLARKAFPLGIDAGVGSLATNVPRYAVQLALGSAQLGLFAALAYLAQVVSMITGALGDSIVAPLAKQAELRNATAFRRLLVKLVLFGLAVSAVTALGALLLGRLVIGLVLGSEYVDQPVLVLLMVGAAAITLQRSLGRGLQAAHLYTSLLVVDSVILVATVGLAAVLVPAFGLVGAAVTLGLGFLIGITLSVVLLVRVLRSMQRDTERSVAA